MIKYSTACFLLEKRKLIHFVATRKFLCKTDPPENDSMITFERQMGVFLARILFPWRTVVVNFVASKFLRKTDRRAPGKNLISQIRRHKEPTFAPLLCDDRHVSITVITYVITVFLKAQSTHATTNKKVRKWHLPLQGVKGLPMINFTSAWLASLFATNGAPLVLSLFLAADGASEHQTMKSLLILLFLLNLPLYTSFLLPNQKEPAATILRERGVT
jgi:hypothetical protein